MLIEILTRFLIVFTTLFVIVDPIGIVPMFLSLTREQDANGLKRTVAKSCFVGALTLIVFSLFGGRIFTFLSLNLDAFRAGGGLLLLLTALDAIRGQRNSCRCSATELTSGEQGHDISIVPIAIPMLAGPGAITSVMVFSTDHIQDHAFQFLILVLAIMAVFGVSYFVLRTSSLWRRVLGESGISAVQRIMGLLLAALSLQLIVEGTVRLVRQLLLS
jgi:multiple antibiotic resistance protein